MFAELYLFQTVVEGLLFKELVAPAADKLAALGECMKCISAYFCPPNTHILLSFSFVSSWCSIWSRCGLWTGSSCSCAKSLEWLCEEWRYFSSHKPLVCMRLTLLLLLLLNHIASSLVQYGTFKSPPEPLVAFWPVMYAQAAQPKRAAILCPQEPGTLTSFSWATVKWSTTLLEKLTWLQLLQQSLVNQLSKSKSKQPSHLFLRQAMTTRKKYQNHRIWMCPSCSRPSESQMSHQLNSAKSMQTLNTRNKFGALCDLVVAWGAYQQASTGIPWCSWRVCSR